MRVELPGGHWAELKPAEELTRADRKAVNAFVVYEVNAEAGRLVVNAGRDDEANAALLARICTDWSLPFPPPATDPSHMDRLSLEQDDALREAIRPHMEAVLGRNAPVNKNEGPTAGSAS